MEPSGRGVDGSIEWTAVQVPSGLSRAARKLTPGAMAESSRSMPVHVVGAAPIAGRKRSVSISPLPSTPNVAS